MTTNNRQVDTKFNSKQSIDLEVVRSGIYGGKEVKGGDIIKVSKTEAKRILTIHKGLFRIKID